MNMVNRPMRVALRLPFRTPLSSRLMLVRLVGRKTGRIYLQPVSYLRQGETLLTPGGGRWKRNLREGEPVTLRVAGRVVQAQPELVRDADEVEQLVGLMVQSNRRLASFVPFVEPDGSIDRETLQTALGYGFCVVRWHLQGGGS
jgi:hypothetical protein